MNTIVYPVDYEKRLLEYNANKEQLEAKRNEFYRINPNFPHKTMFLQVTAPPKRIIINEIK